MQIRACTAGDMDAAAVFAHLQDSKNGQRTSFMYKDYGRTRSSFLEALGSSSLQLIAFEGATCVGYIQVLIGGEYVPGDVIGPFFRLGEDRVAAALLKAAAGSLTGDVVLKFNIDSKNPLCKILPRLGARKSEDNYQLRLAPEAVAKPAAALPELALADHCREHDKKLIKLYEREFPDSYMDAAALVACDPREYRLVDLLLDSSFAGFALYRIQRGYIDFVAVEPGHRNKGFGRWLLSSVIAEHRRRLPGAGISLNVDLARESALRLYTDLGFTVDEHFASYRLDPKSLRTLEDENQAGCGV